MKFFPIKTFTGVETRNDGTDQDRGTLRKAEGVIIAPTNALSSPPTWNFAYGGSGDGGIGIGSACVTAIAAAGGATNKVHFIRFTDSQGNAFLVCFDRNASKVLGLWHAAVGGVPDFANDSWTAQTLTANYLNKTQAMTWYGTWLGSRLFLGNGSDTNMVWAGGSLQLLTAARTDAFDPSQDDFPPCKAFAMDASGRIYGASASGARVYRSESNTKAYATITGLRNAARDYVDLDALNALGAGNVVALTPADGGMIAHLGNGKAMWVGGEGGDGFAMDQKPLENVVGAVNPRAVANNVSGSSYLGSDYELYIAQAHKTEGFSKESSRTPQLETAKAAGQWNRSIARNVTYDAFIIDDTLNDRVWINAPTTLRSLQALFCFDRKTKSITGPISSPNILVMTPLASQTLSGITQYEGNGSPFIVLAVTDAGALVYADLGKVGELALDDIGTAIGAAYQAAAVKPTPSAGFSCIGVYNNGQSFARVDSGGRVDLLASVWGNWVANGSSVPGGIVEWYNNALLAIVEIAPEDFGSPVLEKDFCEVRLQWRRNSRVYAGVYVESGQYQDGVWAGTPYPDEEHVVPVCVRGTRLRVAIAAVVFNAAPAVLPDISIGILEGGAR